MTSDKNSEHVFKSDFPAVFKYNRPNLTHMECPTPMLPHCKPFIRWLEQALLLVSQTTSFFWVRN